MDKFLNANIRFSSQNNTDYTRVEPYNICNECIVNPCIGVSIIPYSTNIDVQDQIMPTHEFHSLFQKLNNEQCFIFDDVMYRKKQNPNEPIHLFITGGASTNKTFTLMFLIQNLISFYNRHPRSNLLKKKALLMAYIGKTTFNIGGIIVHSSFSIPLNCKDLPSLSLE
jgi:hypothetical protein